MKKLITLFLVFPILAAVAAVATPTTSLWLHVRVDEAEGTKVKVNLPVSMIDKAIAMVPGDHIHDGKIQLDDQEFSVQELRELWTELNNSPDMTFVTVEEANKSVRVWKENGKLRVEVRGMDGDSVDVHVPTQVVDALLSGDGDELNFGAAVTALVDSGEGEIVAVSDTETNVRVWVNSVADGE